VLAPKSAHSTRIAFVQPLIPDGNYLPNLGIMYLAAILLKEGYDVRIFDENIHQNVEAELVSYDPALIGFTCVTAALKSACKMAERLKQKLAKALVIVGGPHLSALPSETLQQNRVVDYGITGEAETSLLDFCERVLRGGDRSAETLRSIPGLVFRDDEGQVVNNRNMRFLSNEELDALPFPAWHLLPIEEVFRNATHGLFARGKRVMPVMTSRGCPNYCAFCCRVMGFKFRTQSLERVISEVRWLYDTYNIDEVYFEDDTFTQDPDRAHALLDAIIALKLPIYIKFANGLRADKVDSALLTKMQRAGVYWVGFGIESGSDHTQALMKKRLDLDLAAKNVAIAKSMGFRVGSNCIIGYPGERLEDISESINYFLKLDLDSFAVVTCVPFPGTTAWQVCKKNGWLTPRANSYDNYWFEVFRVTPLIETPHLSSKQLSREIFKVYIRFYFLNPRRFSLVARMMLKQKLNALRNTHQIRKWMRLLRANSMS
jgi:anaerobic magnesium-protoporphyrin IX monomethyl ester cyclase